MKDVDAFLTQGRWSDAFRYCRLRGWPYTQAVEYIEAWAVKTKCPWKPASMALNVWEMALRGIPRKS